MKIDTEKIKQMITELKGHELKHIEVSTAQINQLRRNPDSIYNSKLNTIMKLQNYANRRQKVEIETPSTQKTKSKNKKYIGVDIGVSNLITMSNLDMQKTLKIKTKDYPQLKKEIDRYRNVSKHIRKHMSRRKNTTTSKDMKLASAKFKKAIHPLLNKIIKKHVLPQFKKHTIFVVGINYLQVNSYETHEIIVKSIIQILGQALEDSPRHSGAVITVNERLTSIKCPKCNRINRDARTSHNAFYCPSCKFNHDDDDVVASVNILMNYMKIKKSR